MTETAPPTGETAETAETAETGAAPARAAGPADGASTLPEPTRRRWTPLRLGLVDMYRYDDEQFAFHDGRLLLRGNNGTGKSKVLALTLPFLLDASLYPYRVEPDADRNKRMEWNLLLDSATGYEERTGYTWIEFGQLDQAGEARYVTLGCGLKAARGRGVARHWFFITSRRIGDLRLIDSTKTALNRERLGQELGDSGQIFDKADDYRRAVDQALFGLGERRYAALIDLLIQLRQPQLSRKPDEKSLSRALTEALTPLDQAVLADVADSFHSLDEERARLAELETTREAAGIFLRVHQNYARVASRRAAERMRAADSDFQRVGRGIGDAEAALAQAKAALGQLREADTFERARAAGLEGERDGLRASATWAGAEELDRARIEARSAGRKAQEAAQDLERAEAHAAQAGQRRDGARARAEQRTSQADREAGRAAALADSTGLAAQHAKATGGEHQAAKAIARREAQLDHVDQLLGQAQRARSDHRQRQERADAAQAEAGRRTEAAAQAEANRAEAADRLVDQVQSYLAGLARIHVPDWEERLERLADWAAGDGEGASPVRHGIVRGAERAIAGLAAREQAIRAERDAAEAARDQAAQRLAELEAGAAPEPERGPTRRPADQDGPGAPLWRLVDFGPGVAPDQRAGLEAALEASGLLDAVVRPDGSVAELGSGDLLLAAPGTTAGVSLDGVLAPHPDPGAPESARVPEAVIRAVLGGIGWGEQDAAAWVDGAGRFRLGPERGSWSKPAAQYVGATARAAHRAELIANLREGIEAAREQLARLADLARALEADRAAVRAERDAYPDAAERALELANHAAGAAGREQADAAGRAAEAAQAAGQAAEQADRAEAEAAQAAADVSVPAEAEAISALRRTLADYGYALAALRGAEADAAQARADFDLAAAQAGQMSEEAATRGERRDQAIAAHAEAAERHASLERSIGAEVAELQAGLRRVEEALARSAQRQTQLREAAAEAERALGRAQGRLETLEDDRERAGAARAEAIGQLRGFVSTGLLRIALPGLEHADPGEGAGWNVTAALGLARLAESGLSAVPMSDDAWRAAQQRNSTALTHLQSAMSALGHTAQAIAHDAGTEVRVHYGGTPMGIDQLDAHLAELAAESHRLLSEKERRIIENYLVADVARNLADLISRATLWVEGLNRELAGRNTSTGMKLRIRWLPAADGPRGVEAARKVLQRSDAVWSKEDRDSIGAFLQEQIALAREANPDQSWQDHLTRAFDYRRWHEFAIERYQDGRWRSGAGPASTGERALTLTVPLFAAAASHYQSAGNAGAPRLILLDEAFAGIDDNARSTCMGLFAAFDLDVVMTSEREWGCYPEVPGLAIANLTRVEGIDAVGVSRWRWDGAKRSRAAEPDAASTARAAAGGDGVDSGLF